MPKFEVVVTRTLSLSTSLEVRAKNEEAAEEKALELLHDSLLTWDIKDKQDWQEDSDEYTVDSIDEL